MEQYELDTFGKSHDLMSNFWNSCFDDLMSTAIRRDKDKGDSKAKFQVRPSPRGACLESCRLKSIEQTLNNGLCMRVNVCVSVCVFVCVCVCVCVCVDRKSVV